MILQVSGHVAIDKAAEVLGAQIRHVPIDLKSGIINHYRFISNAMTEL